LDPTIYLRWIQILEDYLEAKVCSDKEHFMIATYKLNVYRVPSIIGMIKHQQPSINPKIASPLTKQSIESQKENYILL